MNLKNIVSREIEERSKGVVEMVTMNPGEYTFSDLRIEMQGRNPSLKRIVESREAVIYATKWGIYGRNLTKEEIEDPQDNRKPSLKYYYPRS